MTFKRKHSSKSFRKFKRAKRAGPPSGRTAIARMWSSAKRLTANKIYAFTRCAPSYTLEMPDTFVSYNPTFSLDSVYQYTDFYNLYDSYRIVKVELMIAMISNPNATVVPAATAVYNPANWYPRLWYIADPTDASQLTLETARVRQGVKYVTLQPNKIKRIVIRAPKCQVQTYRTELTTGYAPKNMWLAMASYNVPHYGIKCLFDGMGINPNDTYPFKFQIDTKYTLAFKGPQ